MMPLSNFTDNDVSRLKTLCIRVKRLRHKDLLRRNFVLKYKLLRPCIARLCRQLLNFEIRFRKQLQITKNNETKNCTMKNEAINVTSSRLECNKQNSVLLNSLNCTSLKRGTTTHWSDKGKV